MNNLSAHIELCGACKPGAPCETAVALVAEDKYERAFAPILAFTRSECTGCSKWKEFELQRTQPGWRKSVNVGCPCEKFHASKADMLTQYYRTLPTFDLKEKRTGMERVGDVTGRVYKAICRVIDERKNGGR